MESTPPPLEPIPPESRLPELPPSELRRRRLLFLAGYGFATLAALALAIALAVMAAAPVEATPLPSLTPLPSATPAPLLTSTSTLTPTQTFTPRPSFTPTPTITLTPTPSPTVTNTPLPPPLLPRAFPVAENEAYELADFNAELADHIIELLEAYPNSLSPYHRGEDNSGYFAAFRYATVLLREALLRLPTDPHANLWYWRLAYDLARSGDPSAGATFATQITQALNDGSVKLEGLEAWALSQSPQIALQAFPLDPSADIPASYLVRLSTTGENGSAFFWLVKTPDRFETYPLGSDFDFIHPTVMSFFTADLTGDGVAEVVIYRSAIPGSSTYLLPRIYDLSQRPPVELSFEPGQALVVGPEFQNSWSVVDSGPGSLQFKATVFPPCPVTVQRIFGWNGLAFTMIGDSFTLDPQPQLLAYCNLVVDHAARVWGLEPAIQIMESLLPGWPPELDVDGNPYPADALDEWRFLLGIYYALLGNGTAANESLRAITANPATPDSRWIALANEFLQAYLDPRSIYRACLTSSLCDPRLAFKALVATFSVEDYSLAPQILEDAGVAVRSSGFFDFDQDGETERWLVLRHGPQLDLEFWILAKTETGVEAVFVAYVNTNQPLVELLEPVEEPPVIQVEPDITFTFTRQQPGGKPQLIFTKPQIVFSADLTQQALDKVQEDLLSGGDPAQALDDLRKIHGSPYFTCSYVLCPQYDYLLGLANELAGNPRAAIDAYLELWRFTLESPYTIPARLKLIGEAVLPTSTPVASPTRTPTASRTPTPSGTPPTATPSPSGTPPTATPSLTPTLSPTPSQTTVP